MFNLLKKINKLNKQVSYYNKESIWHSIQEVILKRPWFSFLLSIVLLLLGAFTAALINFISIEEYSFPLLQNIISFAMCLLILVIGFIVFINHWSFRKKYIFLEDFDVELAQQIVLIHKRANRVLSLIDGAHAIQLFQVERHTTDNNLIFKFKKIFSLKSNYFDLSRFKKKKLIVPITFFKWIITEEKKSIPSLNKFNHMIHAWLVAEQNRDPSQNFNHLIENWNYNSQKRKKNKAKINSVHFHVLFDTMDTIIIPEYPDNIMDYVQIINYNGNKSKHYNRQYCTLRLTLSSNSGSIECIIQLIMNKSISSEEEIAYVFDTLLLPFKGD